MTHPPPRPREASTSRTPLAPRASGRVRTIRPCPSTTAPRTRPPQRPARPVAREPRDGGARRDLLASQPPAPERNNGRLRQGAARRLGARERGA